MAFFDVVVGNGFCIRVVYQHDLLLYNSIAKIRFICT